MFSDLIALDGLDTEDVEGVLRLAGELKAKLKCGGGPRPLEGRSVALLFEKPSLRTRMTFEVGVYQLGGLALFVEEQLGVRESIADVARNLERWVDVIVARTHKHESIVELAEYASVPVINALSDRFHPCQVLADALTLREHRGSLDGQRVAFVGDGNNVFASWACLAGHYAIHLTLVCPEGYEPRDDVRQYAREHAKGSFRICHDPADGVADADVIYTDVWASMGQEDEAEERAAIFAAYQVNEKLMAAAKRDAIFMHCLPAHRGEEVTDAVIEGDQSVVFDQAENRLHVQKAVLCMLIGDSERNGKT